MTQVLTFLVVGAAVGVGFLFLVIFKISGRKGEIDQDQTFLDLGSDHIPYLTK